MLAMSISNTINFEEISSVSKALGLRIRTARIRRKIRQEDLSKKTTLSRSTIQSIERGGMNYAVGSLLNVLWTLGLINEVALIADPGLDRDGLTLAIDAESKRVSIPRKIDNDF